MIREPARYWFRRKRGRLGWGYTPISLEGWLVVLAFLVICYVGDSMLTVHIGMSVVWAPIIWVMVNIVALFAIIIAKAEPKPKA